jgi:hypothetical protein
MSTLSPIIKTNTEKKPKNKTLKKKIKIIDVEPEPKEDLQTETIVETNEEKEE